MNREEIIERLESIGVTPMAIRPTSFKGYVDVFQKFAALVAAKEREECAKVLDAVYKVQEARRAYADSTTLGGANHQYFSQVMTAIASASDKIRARGQQ
jgi:hypothetical protein